MINSFICKLFVISLFFLFNNAFGYDSTEACNEYVRPCYFIVTLKNQIEIITQDINNKAEVYASIQSIVDRVLNIREISKFVAGSYWNTMSTDEQEEFIDEYGQYVKRMYSKQLCKYSTYDMSILSVKNPKEGHYLINTRLSNESDDHNFIIVEFNLISTSDGFLLSDLKVNNAISLSVTQRSIIKNIVSKQGIDGMLTYFRSENSAAKY
ncbi:ABC transporter substrate-binding protein [Ehrlichia minasensis]|uniref:ABC transporter substrate-binding protein n=1 Tax=Ehrlichia minasensis TaxID=1242993 RepID=A0A4Q6I9Q5_9RICK|nr:ABC transporter substrate-binding protein [Ehrlichia minasensis]RZB12757.1 ABC transporter substrate-binding protein [Ehrlichia minasensis]CEI85113.1 Putative ABC-type transport system involved in re sistance to organic solvents auxiliary component [Ehrlichia minasensis]